MRGPRRRRSRRLRSSVRRIPRRFWLSLRETVFSLACATRDEAPRLLLRRLNSVERGFFWLTSLWIREATFLRRCCTAFICWRTVLLDRRRTRRWRKLTPLRRLRWEPTLRCLDLHSQAGAGLCSTAAANLEAYIAAPVCR